MARETSLAQSGVTVPTSAKTPPFRRQRHKTRSGRAYVVLDGRRHYLGTYDDPIARAEYDRLIAEWLANGRSGSKAQPTGDLTITELAVVQD